MIQRLQAAINWQACLLFTGADPPHQRPHARAAVRRDLRGTRCRYRPAQPPCNLPPEVPTRLLRNPVIVALSSGPSHLKYLECNSAASGGMP